MYMQGKYIMTDNGPILFPESFQHSDFKQHGPKSAGYFTIGKNKNREMSVFTYSDSFSLKLKPDKDDERKIKNYFDGV